MSWAQRADDAITVLAAERAPFSADDLLERIGPPDPSHAPNGRNNGVGSVFARAHKAGLIHVVGHVQSKQPKRKGGLIRLWAGGPT